tara:strand:+ start:196 stop:504 length:309 start_codon:yes stop_codon:yes gene_type:complete
MKIKKGDTVIIITGKDRGRQGTVQEVDVHRNKITVEAVNIVKKHMKAQGMRAAEIIEKEQPLFVSNVMLICPHCTSPTRTSRFSLGDGSKARKCKKCEEVIE